MPEPPATPEPREPLEPDAPTNSTEANAKPGETPAPSEAGASPKPSREQPLHGGTRSPWNTFFFTVGGSALYLLSGVLILLGVAEVLLPMYDRIKENPQGAIEKLYCIGVLHVYEIALLAVTLLILLWKNVTDDAISLTLLMAAFLVGSAITLDTIAPDFPFPALMFGIMAMLLAVAKLYAWSRWVTHAWQRVLYPAVLAVLAWNFFMPAVLGYAQKQGMVKSALAGVWHIGWGAGLIALAMLFVAVLALPKRRVIAGRDFTASHAPFLRTAGMRWIVLGIVVLATVTHQAALPFAFAIPWHAVDMLPVLGVLALLGGELMRVQGVRRPAAYVATHALPIAVAMGLLLTDGYRVGFDPATPWLWLSHPPYFLLTMAIVMLLPLLRSRQTVHGALAGAYASLAVACFGAQPGSPLPMNLLDAGLIAGGTAMVIATAHRSVAIAWVGAWLIAAGVWTDPQVGEWVHQLGSARWALASVAFGLVTQLTTLAGPRQTPPRAAMLSGLCLAAGLIRGVNMASFSPAIMLAACTGVLLLVLLSAWLTRQWWTALPGGVPLGHASYTLLHDNRSWLFIAGAFLALVAGAVLSVMKGTRADKESPASLGGEVG